MTKASQMAFAGGAASAAGAKNDDGDVKIKR
jgi:hypothetical protein